MDLDVERGFERCLAIGEVVTDIDVLSVAEERALRCGALRFAAALQVRFAAGLALRLTAHVAVDVRLRIAASLTARLTGRHAIDGPRVALTARVTARRERRLARRFTLGLIGLALTLTRARGAALSFTVGRTVEGRRLYLALGHAGIHVARRRAGRAGARRAGTLAIDLQIGRALSLEAHRRAARRAAARRVELARGVRLHVDVAALLDARVGGTRDEKTGKERESADVRKAFEH